MSELLGALLLLLGGTVSVRPAVVGALGGLGGGLDGGRALGCWDREVASLSFGLERRIFLEERRDEYVVAETGGEVEQAERGRPRIGLEGSGGPARRAQLVGTPQWVRSSWVCLTTASGAAL